ncbi:MULTISPECIES: glutathione binding-like protein [Limnobacter]|uniref:Glutathione S-transferase family protein n=1 Tax=Limnobacter profundi TaxID=2732163 RepID=A0ABX6N8F8_9BURK|nr:glutathione binding-like protein [Limnobacter sp. SAORIC-580]QJR29647.1 glutathione S-transferase family protein [Limnobacter sp. SAORIC-580]
MNTAQNEPIQVYTWTTPNGYKIHIACEEMGLQWKPVAVDIGKGDQFKPEFLKFSPNNKIPAIIDPHGPDGKPLELFESGAILIYLAEKTGKFFGNGHRERLSIIQWLMFQMGGVGPMLGQAHHFRIYAPEPIEYAINRYTNEAKRLYEVINKQLNEFPYIAGENYSIADMALYPWVYRWQRQGIELSDYPAVHKWYEELSARPAVIKALNVNLE